jgi:hypothetical protein
VNQKLQDYARNYLKTELAKLPEGNQSLFKLMYGRNGGTRPVEETSAMPVDSVVDEMPADKLDWAMQQVINTPHSPAEAPATGVKDRK